MLKLASILLVLCFPTSILYYTINGCVLKLLVCLYERELFKAMQSLLSAHSVATSMKKFNTFRWCDAYYFNLERCILKWFRLSLMASLINFLIERSCDFIINLCNDALGRNSNYLFSPLTDFLFDDVLLVFLIQCALILSFILFFSLDIRYLNTTIFS